MFEQEEIKEKLNKGWIRSRLTFEVMATDNRTTKKTLKEHIGKLRKTENNFIIKEKFDKIIELKPPPRDVKQAFSQIVEIEIISRNVETLLFIVIAFAPSSVEILEPKELLITFQTLQVIMNSVADVMHRFASQGMGGIVISAKR